MKARKGTGWLSVIQSTLSAAFGVQKRSKLERDFEEGKPADFIIAGVIGTALFVLVLIVIVNLILNLS
ncbi:hypothetical protein ACH42_02975 [Endozoicomonas sp. (ex Bugula neritina AB1)]|nr:hypothetical protein ACH42_02975 [Endozoicomonas sp. (ex Bugula neritina AB1)]